MAAIDYLHFDSEGPGGSINASVRDMAAWLRFQMDRGVHQGERLVAEETLMETRTPQMVIKSTEPLEKAALERTETTQSSYGMGWTIWDYRGHGVHSHGGAIDGFRSTLAIVPRHKLGVVVMVNGAPTDAFSAIRNTILDRLLGLEPKDWNGMLKAHVDEALAGIKSKGEERHEKRRLDTHPSRELGAYPGTYNNDAYGDVTVAETPHGLTLAWSGFDLPIPHWHHDTFLLKDDDASVDDLVRFTLDANGEVGKLEMIGQTFQRKG